MLEESEKGEQGSSQYLFYIFQHLLLALALVDVCVRDTCHVAMPVKSFYTSEQFLVVTQGDEDLGVIAHGLLQD